MKFELKEEYIQKGETGKPSFVILPSGICEVLINTAGAPVKKNCICNFTKETKINCVLIDVGFIGIYVCGDILITLKEMDYDLASKDDWKRAKKQDREKIVAEYEKLASEQPELFDASKVDTSQLSQVIEKSGAEAATASEEKDTNTDASPEKVDKDKNITVKDLKFPLLESYFTYKTTMKMNFVSQIILPSGKYETESIFNGDTLFYSSGLDCDITGISASKNNNLFKFSASTFGDVRVCGDILITLIEMDKYDFRNKKETKKIKGDKDYILENYFRLLEEKPELFDASKIDLKKMEQEYQSKKKAAAKAKKDEFKIKIAEKLKSYLTTENDEFTGTKKITMKIPTSLGSSISNKYQDVRMGSVAFLFVNVGEAFAVHLIVTTNDWWFIDEKDGLFFITDSMGTISLSAISGDRKVHSGDNLQEYLVYEINREQLDAIRDTKGVIKFRLNCNNGTEHYDNFLNFPDPNSLDKKALEDLDLMDYYIETGYDDMAKDVLIHILVQDCISHFLNEGVDK